MMVVMMMPMPAVPPVGMTVPPVHFRGRQLRIFLNRRGGTGIAQRQRVGALSRRCEREHRADGSESQYLRELHEYSPWSGARLRRLVRRNAARNLRPPT